MKRKTWKPIFQIITAMVILAAIILPSGCIAASKEETISTYTSESDAYSVSLPGEWEQCDTMGLGDMIILNRVDGTEAIITGVGKDHLPESMEGKVESLSDFFDAATSTLFKQLAASADLQDTEAIDLPGMDATMAKEGTITLLNGVSGKLFVECGETQRSYYLLLFSGTKSFDKKLDTIKKNLTFEEGDTQAP